MPTKSNAQVPLQPRGIGNAINQLRPAHPALSHPLQALEHTRKPLVPNLNQMRLDPALANQPLAQTPKLGGEFVIRDLCRRQLSPLLVCLSHGGVGHGVFAGHIFAGEVGHGEQGSVVVPGGVGRECVAAELRGGGFGDGVKGVVEGVVGEIADLGGRQRVVVVKDGVGAEKFEVWVMFGGGSCDDLESGTMVLLVCRVIDSDGLAQTYSFAYWIARTPVAVLPP
jgi:hypothetical protein